MFEFSNFISPRRIYYTCPQCPGIEIPGLNLKGPSAGRPTHTEVKFPHTEPPLQADRIGYAGCLTWPFDITRYQGQRFLILPANKSSFRDDPSSMVPLDSLRQQ
jgi:hypothetical protein